MIKGLQTEYYLYISSPWIYIITGNSFEMALFKMENLILYEFYICFNFYYNTICMYGET